MKKNKSILFVGNCYYNHFYLSRELRELGWRADLLNIDIEPANQMYYHGSDFQIHRGNIFGVISNLFFFVKAIFKYKIFHFANAEGMTFPPFNQVPFFYRIFGKYSEIKILKFFNKIIFYSNNACRDGVTQSSFNKWGPTSVCDMCSWKNNQNVCSDKKNLQWGELRNKYADFIGTLGSNRADFNIASHVHEAPWIYCLDKNVWNPDLLIPTNYLLPFNQKTIKVFHSVGNYDTRNHGAKKQTIKSTEIWIDVISRLKSEGLDVEMIFFKDVPNIQIKYYQAQADIFVDMLSFGFFGANIREAMMLGKPAICFLRPEWLSDMSKEIPDYVRELPVISATPETAYLTLKELVIDIKKQRILGKQMRDFGLKWHASDVAAHKANDIYINFLSR
jgi:hypothetical protein